MLERVEPRTSGDGLKAVLAGLSAVLTEAGYAPVDVPVLQEAAPFLELGGEDIRGGLYFTQDRHNGELCLRPEFTIPICSAYLRSPQAGNPVAYSCGGPVFRLKEGTPGERTQADLESFGRPDIAAADAEIVGLALEAVATAGARHLLTQFGDAGLLHELLDSLRLPPNWQRRLKRGLSKGLSAGAILSAAPSQAGDHTGVLAAMAGTDARGARALVDDLLAIAGVATVGGRTAHEIAERFLAQVALRDAPPFGAEQQAVLDRFLAVSGHPDEAAADLRSLATSAGLDLGAALDLFEERTSFMAVQGVDLATVTFTGGFVRNLDYYTGFVFEARDPGAAAGPVIGGGRYDRLAQALGSSVPIPAVGAAIWVDRIEARS